MAIPTSHVLARKLHEAGIIAAPDRMRSIEIFAEVGSAVIIRTETILDDGAVDTLVCELRSIAEATI